MGVLRIRKFRLYRIDEAEELLTTLVLLIAIKLRLKALYLGSGCFAVVENQLLVPLELGDEVASGELSLVETVRWRQERNVLRREGVRSGMPREWRVSRVLRVWMRTAVRGRIGGNVLSVLVG